jgi:putative ABC transport system ATP-binding protein
VPEPILAAQNVSVSYGKNGTRRSVLNDVSLSFETGALTLIMGPSGSGKTTLLSLLGCLLTPDTGSVVIDGAEVCSLNERERSRLRKRHIGFIFQAFRLFHSLSAFENVMIAAELSGARDQQYSEIARQLLQNLGLGEKLQLKPNALSGGEQQRVAIGRALLSNPKILLADEPTAALDSAAGRQIGDILRTLADEHQRTIVVVSHDPRWASFAHRTVILEDGRVVDDRSK